MEHALTRPVVVRVAHGSGEVWRLLLESRTLDELHGVPEPLPDKLRDVHLCDAVRGRAV